jgi:hypothetical protein
MPAPLAEGLRSLRRLCRVRVVGIANPVDLYELHGDTAPPQWQDWRAGYETALTHFESGRWVDACRALYPLLTGQDTEYDVSCLELATRALECLKTHPEDFDPTWVLRSK